MNIYSPFFIVSAVSVLASALIGHAQPAKTAGQTSPSPIVLHSSQKTSQIEGNALMNANLQPIGFARQIPKLNDTQTRAKHSIGLKAGEVHQSNSLSKHTPAKEPTSTAVHRESVRFTHKSQASPRHLVEKSKTVSRKILQLARQQQPDVSLYWLSRAVEAEAGGESQAVKLAVADVILNRVHSSRYPNSVKGVIFQQVSGVYAFTSVENGFIYHQPSAATVRAAKEALYGHKNIVPSALVFYNNADTSAANWVKTRPVIATLGAMTFAR